MKEKIEKYSPKRKYMWAGIGAGLGALYGGLPFTIFHTPAVGTWIPMKIFLGYDPVYHGQGADEKALLLNSLLWAAAIGGWAYLIKDDSKFMKKLRLGTASLVGFGSKFMKKLRLGVAFSLLGLAIGLPAVLNIISANCARWHMKNPPGFVNRISNESFYNIVEMSCSLEDILVYAPSSKAGIPEYVDYESHPNLEKIMNSEIKLFNIIEDRQSSLEVKGTDPVWHQSGDWIYYTKYENSMPNIYRVKPNRLEETLVEKGMALSSFSESGKAVKVDREGYIWIDDEKTPFTGIEPFLIEDKNILVYQRENKGIYVGNVESGEERLISRRARLILANILVPTKGPYKNKVIASDYHNDDAYGIYVIDPETGEEAALLESTKRGLAIIRDFDISSNGEELYVAVYSPNLRGRLYKINLKSQGK